jgi:hypothetical protein
MVAAKLIMFLCLFLAQQPPVGQGLLIHEVSRSHTTTHHSRYGSSGRVISTSQIPLSDNTQHSQQTTSMPSVGFETTMSAGERPWTYALERAATGTGNLIMLSTINTAAIRSLLAYIQNIPDWCRHLYSSCGSAKHR